MIKPDNSKVICPNCCHQFAAICVDDQSYRSRIEAALEQIIAADSWSKRSLKRLAEEALLGKPKL